MAADILNLFLFGQSINSPLLLASSKNVDFAHKISHDLMEEHQNICKNIHAPHKLNLVLLNKLSSAVTTGQTFIFSF